MLERPFCPHYGTNQLGTLAALGNVVKNLVATDTTARVLNTGSGDLYIRTYNSLASPAPVADNTCARISAGQALNIYADNTQDRMSLYSLAGTTFEVMTGVGGL